MRIRLVALAAALAASTTVAAADRPGKPNVIVIVADDLGSADVGFRGCKDIPTPHLDALAKRGVVCSNGSVTHPFCSPTRAALLTGRYQQRFGHEYNPAWEPENKSLGLPLDQMTLADVLKAAGYTTGLVGKWHLGAHPTLYPTRRGFDHYFGLLGGQHDFLEHNLFRTNPVEAKIQNFAPLVRGEEPVEETGYLTDVLGREAAAFVESHRAGPFFLYLAFNAPHMPMQATAKYLDRVKGIADEKRRTYAAMVSALDDAVGTLTSKLAEHNLTDDTLVVFVSDNGGPSTVNASSNAPLRGVKGQVYEGGVRVPFVVSWPAKLKPGTFGHPVSTIDVFPTAATAAGATPPKGVTLDGVDLVPHLSGAAKSSLAGRPLYWRTGAGQSLAVRRGPLKLVAEKGRADELYDLSADPGEVKDLSSTRPADAAALRTRLDAWNATLVAPLWPPPAQAKKK